MRHRDGLGALAPAFPGAAQRLVAEPMAALVSPGSPVRVWARGSWPGLGTGSLPVQEGEEIRLPAGQYRAWVESHGKLEFHRFPLVSGKQHRLPEPPEPELFLELWDGFRGRVIPHSWEETALIEVAANRFAVPAVASRLQIQEETPGGHALIEDMCGHNMGVEDPYLELFESQQPTERFAAFQRGLIDEMADLYGL